MFSYLDLYAAFPCCLAIALKVVFRARLPILLQHRHHTFGFEGMPGSTQGIDNHLQPSPRCLRLSGLWASGGPGLDLAHPCVP